MLNRDYLIVIMKGVVMKINDNFEKTDFCPECGAPLVDNMNCWEQLGGIIALEYEYPDLYAEHFKTVACYNIQHPAQFTDEAIAGLKIALVEHLDKGISVTDIRRRNARAYKGSKRVMKDIDKRLLMLRTWNMTISDVYNTKSPENTAERVRKWAETIREELS